ncbi:hypothetical protein [Pontimicrobium sp. IMCC45349]|uniref:hypothetical protein n=1 Tax=Pontimicrobium sp. IMCC45349 TaxID=3391574 RepID=UPI0039A2493E
MVRIIKIEKRQSEDGREFNSLIIQGGVEMVQSKETGNFYATARKASITSTFDDETAQGLIGQEIPGRIEKAKCDPYEVINQDTGEVTVLHHRYVYVSEETPVAGSQEEHTTISPEEVRFPQMAEA